MQRTRVSRGFCRFDEWVSWEPTAMWLATDPRPNRVAHFMHGLLELNLLFLDVNCLRRSSFSAINFRCSNDRVADSRP
jgi:hypothetical protein